jgi:hypothetical protein
MVDPLKQMRIKTEASVARVMGGGVMMREMGFGVFERGRGDLSSNVCERQP